jgi:hypothetical protein
MLCAIFAVLGAAKGQFLSMLVQANLLYTVVDGEQPI